MFTDGQIIVLSTANSARDVQVLSQTSTNIVLNGNAAYTLKDVQSTLTLMYSSTASAWIEIGRGTGL